jgi:CRISPR-associated exonuclease Cas4
MHGYFARGYTPRVKPGKACRACSLNEICLPSLPAAPAGVRSYIEKALNEETL